MERTASFNFLGFAPVSLVGTPGALSLGEEARGSDPFPLKISPSFPIAPCALATREVFPDRPGFTGRTEAPTACAWDKGLQSAWLSCHHCCRRWYSLTCLSLHLSHGWSGSLKQKTLDPNVQAGQADSDESTAHSCTPASRQLPQPRVSVLHLKSSRWEWGESSRPACHPSKSSG